MTLAIPDVPGSLLLGNLSQLRRDRIGFLRRVSAEYGDIARIRIGAFSVVVLSSPELTQQLLVEHNDAFVKGLGLSLFAKPLLGEGLLISEREVHKRQRRMMAPAFMHKRIRGYADTIGAFVERRVSLLRGRSEVDLAKEMMELTFEIIGKTMFGADVSGDAKEVGDAVTVVLDTITAQLYSALPIPPSVPTPRNLRNRLSIRRLDRVVYRLIRERRAAGTDAGDLMSMLLLAQDEEDGTGMSDKQVRDEVMTALIAGHETTANALVWSFYLLAQHPAARLRLEAELDAVLGGRVPTMDDLPALPFTLSVFKEAMRLYPPAYIVTRRATRDIAIGPYSIRKHQLVAVDIVGMHYRADFFPEPHLFDPDRFSSEREKRLKKGAYMPFGGGPRICIGNHFALMEGQLALAHLAQHYRFESLPGQEPEPDAGITLRPKHGMRVHVTARQASRALPAPTESVA